MKRFKKQRIFNIKSLDVETKKDFLFKWLNENNLFYITKNEKDNSYVYIPSICTKIVFIDDIICIVPSPKRPLLLIEEILLYLSKIPIDKTGCVLSGLIEKHIKDGRINIDQINKDKILICFYGETKTNDIIEFMSYSNNEYIRMSVLTKTNKKVTSYVKTDHMFDYVSNNDNINLFDHIKSKKQWNT